MNQPARVAFLYIAQAHQVLHSLTVALELARGWSDIQVDLIATSKPSLDYMKQTAAALGGGPVRFRLLGPAMLRALAPRDGVPPKLAMLAANALGLSRYDVIVTPERTTAALRWMGVRKTRLIYTQHGAGDRAGPFEPRLGRFDLVFAAGAKQRDRMVAEGLVAPEKCAVVGYPKFDVVDALAATRPRLFADDRPVVLYNPHFDPRLSSWPRWGVDVLAAFAGQDRYNLIFAPHLRLFGGAPASAIPALAPFANNSAIHVDLGGPMAVDMTYTTLADVYLGDASSQIYEFLRHPKPCLFLNAHNAAWRGEESYRHWRFGPVLTGVDGLISAVDAAVAGHGDFIAEQQASLDYTFDLGGERSSLRAARAIAAVARPT